MQSIGSPRPYGFGLRTKVFVIAVLAAALAPLVPAHAAGTLDRVRQAGKLVLGYRADAQPFSYRDEAGKPAGYSVSICANVAERMKTDLAMTSLSVEWIPVTLEDRFQAVQQGRIDLLCDAGSATLTRRRDVSFSVPIFPGGVGALLRADAPTGLRDVLAGRPSAGPIWRGNPAQVLQAKTFSAVAGTTGASWLAERIDTLKIEANAVPVKDYESGIRRVMDRSSDALFGERAILLDAARRGPSARNLIVLNRQFTYEPLALALPRNDEDFRLAVDAALSRLLRSPEFDALYTRSFGKMDESTRAFIRSSALPE
jgi:polar amino acid transport system substrate-binding protein